MKARQPEALRAGLMEKRENETYFEQLCISEDFTLDFNYGDKAPWDEEFPRFCSRQLYNLASK